MKRARQKTSYAVFTTAPETGLPFMVKPFGTNRDKAQDFVDDPDNKAEYYPREIWVDRVKH